jgi:hypothetical protein
MGPTALERHFVLWFKQATGGDRCGNKAPRFLAVAVGAALKQATLIEGKSLKISVNCM